jgi:hypothetical protein
MEMNPPIVVNAYNRPAALARLLGSLQKAEYPRGLSVPLLISLDDSATQPDVARVAGAFDWGHGVKSVIVRNERLGAVGHFYACGALAAEHGAIVYLEDDLLAGRQFYRFARQALESFSGDPCIAGVSLYALWFNGYTQHPFIPLADGSDAFFLQVPYTQGLAFTAAQWQSFETWRAALQPTVEHPTPMHESWAHFSRDEWFPEFTRFVVQTGRFFAYPRVSQTTGFGDAGTHFAAATPFFQAPLERGKTEYHFLPRAQALAVYDSFFELLPDRLARLAPQFHGQDVTLDLYATRTPQNIPTSFVLTTRPVRRAIATFGRAMQPHEANLEHAVPGNEIAFARKEDVCWGRLADWQSQRANDRYFARGKRMGMRRLLKGLVVDFFAKFGKA